jgi:hypothetical protein
VKKIPLLNNAGMPYKVEASIPDNMFPTHVVWEGRIFYEVSHYENFDSGPLVTEYREAVGSMVLDPDGIGTTWTFGW